jgi:L-seryl-tRNA(Ser) seleniumtransferase
MDGSIAGKLRALPAVQHLLDLPEGRRLAAVHPRAALIAALRRALEEARTAIRGGHAEPAAPPDLLHRAHAILHAEAAPRLTRVINATGIILHTNLGRAPLPQAAIAAMQEASGYCTLEYDLAKGARGSRTQAIQPLLRRITGAEAAIAVNNNAAAVLLGLTALAAGGEVVVSRGELIEIGGGFRIPDIISQGGACLMEVGTTNKTRLADYAAAITPATKILFKAHQSNFRIIGFTQSVGIAELAALARSKNLLVMHDLGSGALTDPLGTATEPTVQSSIQAGADIVAFSGDKLLGGPQCGILAGTAAAIDPIRTHPLLRALRLDKVTLAALEATLRLHEAGDIQAIPALCMAAQTPATLRARAERLLQTLPPGFATIEPSAGSTGGGTMPGVEIPSISLTLSAPTPDATPDTLAERLRAHTPPVIARIAGGRLVLDMLTVSDNEIAPLSQALLMALTP